MPTSANDGEETPTPVEPPSGIQEHDVVKVAIVCVGVAVGILAVGFVWSLVGSIRLQKNNKLLSSKEKRSPTAVQMKHSRLSKLSNVANAATSSRDDVESTGSSIRDASSNESTV